MALVELSHIRKLFGSSSDETLGPEVFRELLVMVLARATDADAYTHPVEVSSVQKVIKEYLDEDISSNDVRIAALSELYEAAPLEKYLTRVGPRLPLADRRRVIAALIEVLRADDRVASSEADYFNMVAGALKLSFADVAGLEVE